MHSGEKTDTGSASNIVSFCCQKCGAPLKLDPSLQTFPDKGFLQEISAPLYSGNQPDSSLPSVNVGAVEYTANYVKRSITSQHGRGGGGGESDFTLVGTVGQQANGGAGIGQVIRVNSKMFDILSSQAEIDHPLCEDCTDVLLDSLDQQLRITEEECRGYKEFLEQLETTDSDEKEEDYDQTLKQLKAEEAEMMQKIQSLDAECKKLDSELLAEAGKQNDLREEEQDFLKEYNELKRQVIALEDEDRSAENQLKYAEMQLDRLTKVNAFNATFHIWHNGHFGTINGFRLGRLPNIPVDWNEINTAWGQTVLLLHSLARKMDLKFQRFRLVPYGSHSYIESLTDRTKELPLYCTGGYRFFWDKKFDSAMVAFLDCLQQFKEQVERGDSQFCLPYRMTGGKIEDTSTGSSYSIKVQFNSEEQWTKALKFMLTNLRWGLAWVSSQFSNND